MNDLLKTGITGLDELFGDSRGIRWIGERPPAILIRGGPGAGKSILSSHIASSIHGEGKSVLYFTLEQFAKDNMQLLKSFDWANRIDPIPDLNTSSLPLTALNKNTYLLCQYPATLNRAFKETHSHATSIDINNEFLSYLVARINMFKGGDLGLIVLDGLPDSLREDASLPGDPSDFDVRRAFFSSLCALGQRISPNVPILIILETAKDSDWREFVADVVIDLGVNEESKLRGLADRFLVVRKARNQFAMSGRHPFRILPRQGIEVYPHPSEILWGLRHSLIKHPTASATPDTVPFSTIENMQNFMVRDMVSGGAIRAGHVTRGSSTLLMGQGRTRKNGLSVSFLKAAGMENVNEHLYLVAGQSHSVAKEMIQWYLPKVGGGDSADKIKINVCSIDEYGESTAEVVKRIREHISHLTEFSRVVVNDISVLPNHAELIPILKGLFETRGLTSLFVQTVASGARDSQYRDYFDSALVARQMTLPDGLRQAIVYQLHRYQGTSPVAPLWELRATQTKLSFVNTLRHCAEGSDGELHIPPLEIVLFFEQGSARKEYKTMINSTFGVSEEGESSLSEAPSVVLLPRESADLTMDSFRSLSVDYPLSKTQVVCIDDPWAEEMMLAGKLESLEERFSIDERAEFLEEAIKGGSTKASKELYAIPHHIDFGFYVLDIGFYNYLISHFHKEPENGFTWEDLAAHSLLYETQEKFKSEKSIPELTSTAALFGLSSGALDETVLCFILEILHPALDFRPEIKTLGIERPEISELIFALLTHLHTMRACCSLVSKTPDDESDIFKSALIQRHWYVSFRRLLNKERLTISESKFKVIKPPRIKLNDDKQFQARCLKGEWFLGIVKNSPYPERGAWAIKSLTSQSANQEIFRLGLGLPTRKQMFQSANERIGLTKDLLHQYITPADSSTLWSRRSIESYHLARQILMEGFSRILNIVQEPNTELNNLPKKPKDAALRKIQSVLNIIAQQLKDL